MQILDPIPGELTPVKPSFLLSNSIFLRRRIGPLHDPVTWYGINYTGTQVTQWDFQNKGTRTSPARISFVSKVPLRNLLPSVIYSVPCDRIVQRVHYDVLISCVRIPSWRSYSKIHMVFIIIITSENYGLLIKCLSLVNFRSDSAWERANEFFDSNFEFCHGWLLPK